MWQAGIGPARRADMSDKRVDVSIGGRRKKLGFGLRFGRGRAYL